MVIYGWGGGTPKDQGPVLPTVCSNCGNATVYRLISFNKWFRLYFIPLVPYGYREWLMCPICNVGIELSTNAQRDAARHLQARVLAVESGELAMEQFNEYLKEWHLPSADESTYLPSPLIEGIPPTTPHANL